MQFLRAGIDIGSTTVKLVLLNDNNDMIFGRYRRHCADTQRTLLELLREAREEVGACFVRAKITGSGAINLGRALGIAFEQEVVAVAAALQGFLIHKMAWYERLVSVAGGLLMLIPGILTDVIGFVLVAGVIVLQVLTRKKAAAVSQRPQSHPLRRLLDNRRQHPKGRV